MPFPNDHLAGSEHGAYDPMKDQLVSRHPSNYDLLAMIEKLEARIADPEATSKTLA